MNDKKIDILKHALGLNKSKTSYRNFIASDIEGSEYQPILDDLESNGLIKLGHTSQYLNYYYVTEKGKNFLEEATRS